MAEGVARRSEEGLREVIETMPAMAWSGLPLRHKISFVFRHDPSSEVAKGYEKYLRQCDLIDGAQHPAGGREELSEGVVDQFAAFFDNCRMLRHFQSPSVLPGHLISCQF